jgi:hypothetical protein
VGGVIWGDFIIHKIETLHRIIVECKLVLQKQIYMQRQMQRNVVREREMEQDRIMGKKILLTMVVIAWLVAATASYLDGGTGANALIKILTGVYNFMLSYINFSQKVLCDMISFVVGLIFVVLFSLSTITIIMLLFIPFIAIIFTFTDI